MSLLNIFKKKSTDKELGGIDEKKEIRAKDLEGKEKTEKKKSKDKPHVGIRSKEEKALKPGAIRIDQSAHEGERVASIILKPRITEKASFITEDGAYTFNVDKRANKIQIKEAIQEIYNVKPIHVNIVSIPSKTVIIRNKRGVKSGGKKAIVFLKEGDRIEFV